MTSSFEETLIEVWGQTLVEDAKSVALGQERYPVRRTPKRGLRQVDFVFDGLHRFLSASFWGCRLNHTPQRVWTVYIFWPASSVR
jgi:hypothetical protein